ncbi:unnamed protein product [Rhizoctonia solani]|uniref:Uncharacterized protein n=1 Tax=Rhizoctonia solani TaxID=456999 RepID=A0A8H3CB89_9AGAM|nr:unnamed protein product [Rhizoctonia solani]
MGYGSLYFRSNLLAPWQWFTLINGVLTFATALAFYLYFPDSISTAHFLTEEEKRIAAERVSEHETNAESKEWKPEQRRLDKENRRRELVVGETDDFAFAETDLTDIQNPKFRYVL